MLSFNDTLNKDHINILTSSEFGISCLNARTALNFDVIKTDAFIMVDEQGLPVIEDKPMFNTINSNDIKQDDRLIIDSNEYVVREVKKDGIGGLDIYLKG